MDCMMACLSECTLLWPDAAMEPSCHDSKDDSADGECNHRRDTRKRAEGHPALEGWQAEQVTDGGHKPTCSALSKDPPAQVRCRAMCIWLVVADVRQPGYVV